MQKLRVFYIVFMIMLGYSSIVNSQTSIGSEAENPRSRLHFSYDHVPPVNAIAHEEVLFSVSVDQMVTGDEVRIHFRKPGKSGFHAMPMGYNPTEGRFEVGVDERYHGNHSIEYFIELFPVGLTPIRIPETRDQYLKVKLKKKLSRILEPLLIFFLIISPAVGAYMFTKARKAHSKRRAEYERRIRSRRRKLTKEREKHYKEYLKTLSGGRKSSQDHYSFEEFSRKRESKNLDIPQKNSPSVPEKSKPLARKGFSQDFDTDDELRRELDNILSKSTNAETVLLNKQSPAKKTPPTKKSPPASPAEQKTDTVDLNDDDKQTLHDLFD